MKRGRPMRTHCKHGHEFTPDNVIYRHNSGMKSKYRRCKACEIKRSHARVGKPKRKLPRYISTKVEVTKWKRPDKTGLIPAGKCISRQYRWNGSRI